MALDMDNSVRCDIFENHIVNRRFATPNRNLTKPGFSTPNRNMVAKSRIATPNKNMVVRSATPNKNVVASSTPKRKLQRYDSATPNKNLTPFKKLRFDDNIDITSSSSNIGSGFTIEGILGTGGFGSVFLGRHRGDKVAIKTLHKCTKNIVASRQSFRAEMNAVGLRHENIVTVMATTSLEDFESGAFIIMEFVGKRNLLQAINDSSTSMPMMQCVRYGIEISRALHYLHTKGIAHLDVKPANVMLTNNGRCKLGDFGCSQRIVSGKVDTPRRRSSRSALNGTLAFRAPELLRGGVATTKADTFSFGVTLWQMLTRETPYEGQDQHAIVFSVVAYNKRPQFPEQLLSTSDWYQNLCSDCWGRNPESRPDADHVIALLQQRLDGYGDADNA